MAGTTKQRFFDSGRGGGRAFVRSVGLLGWLALIWSMGAIDSATPGVVLVAKIAAALGAVVVALAGWWMADELEPARRAVARAGLLVVLAHFLLALMHAVAHDRLGVGLSVSQMVWLAAVVIVAPILAAVLLYTSQARRGALLLAASMAGGLLFGLYWHYLAVSPDHVGHLPPGDARGLFRLTAAGLLAAEALGVATGWWGWRRLGLESARPAAGRRPSA